MANALPPGQGWVASIPDVRMTQIHYYILPYQTSLTILYHTLSYSALLYPTLHDPTLPYTTLPYSALPYPALHYPMPLFPTLPNSL